MKPNSPVYNAAFSEAYSKLNANQRLATDAIEGPVMVIAGPGTGKTQILAVRIGNILLNTDASPSNILCLTFTDAGAATMRRRLLDFIGPHAYEVAIHTFHSFCNKIIRENPEEFSLLGEFDAASDLEKKQILHKVINEIPKESLLFNYKENYQNLITKLETLFSDIKKENWDPAQMLIDIDDMIAEMRSSEEYIYKRASGNYKKGDFNENKFNVDKKKLDRAKEAINLFFEYERILAEWQRYDYEDMIRWVLEKFQTDQNFLASYQEKYQYVLVDEYQDTNGAQNEILYQLISYWDSPNAFVVGDDDQAIFRFQGANVTNMIDFYNKYHPEVIVLKENYRSTQIILDHAAELIKNNQERLIHLNTSWSKDLIAANTSKMPDIAPSIIEYENPIQEIFGTYQTVQTWLDQGVPPDQIAILYRKNKDAEPFIKIFQHRNIPFHVTKEISVLEDVFIKHILNFLFFFANHQKQLFSQDDLLCELLLAPFVKIDTAEINRIFWNINLLRQESKTPNEEEETNIELSVFNQLKQSKSSLALQEFVGAIESLIEAYPSCTPQVFFETLLVKMKIFDYVLNHDDRNYLLQLIHTLFDLIKRETSLHPDWTLKEIVTMLKEMIANNVVLRMEHLFGTKEGVQLSTLFKAKGLEYEKVIMIKCNENEWNAKDNNSFTLPVKYSKSDKNNKEDDRRLFYVGMTRAKGELHISYASKDTKGKNSIPCAFVGEIVHGSKSQVIQSKIATDVLAEYLVISMSPFKKDFTKLEQQFFENYVEHFTLNPTALTKYLDCRLAFFYENVLRVPLARKPALGFGTAVHLALNKYFRKTENREQVNEQYLLDTFKDSMEKYKSHFSAREYENYFYTGKTILPGFVKSQIELLGGVEEMQFEKEIQTEISSVPVTGKLDRIDRLASSIRIVDYKTGLPRPIKGMTGTEDKNTEVSAYWLQMVFYILLLREIPTYRSKSINSVLCFVHPDAKNNFKNAEVVANEDQLNYVKSLIVEVYNNIKKGIFTPGCQKPECKWCSYVRTSDESNLLKMESEEPEESDYN